MISKKFLTSSVIYTFSYSLATVASFLLLPFYTNTRLLSVSDYGAFALYIPISLYVQVIAGIGIEYYVNFAYQEFKHDQQKLKAKMASLNGYILLTSAVLIVIFLLSGHFIISHYFSAAGPNSFRYLMMSVLAGIFSAHFRFYMGLLINMEKPWAYFGINVLNLLTTVLISVVVLKIYPLTLEGPLWGRLLSFLSVFIWSFIAVTSRFGIAIDRSFLKPTLQFCIPIVIICIFQWVQANADRYIIKPLLYNEQLAIFDLAIKFTLLINFLIDGLYSAIAPRILALMSSGRSERNVAEINKYYSSFNLITILLVSFNILLLPVLVPMFINDEKYYKAFAFFGIAAAGFLVRGPWNIFVFPIHFSRQTGRQIIVNGVAAGVEILMGYLTVKYFGLYGAAFTLVAVKIILLWLNAYFSRDLWGEKYNKIKMVWLPFAAMVIICGLELLITGYNWKMHVIHLAEFLLILLLALAAYKNELFELMAWGLGEIRGLLKGL